MDWRLVAQQGVKHGAWETRHREPFGCRCRSCCRGSPLTSGAYKAPGDSPFARASYSSHLALCVALRFSFAISSFPPRDRRPGFRGFDALPTDHLQPSRRIHLRIGFSVLETCKTLRRLTTRLCHSIHFVCDRRAGGMVDVVRTRLTELR